jgi:hypothetical protein
MALYRANEIRSYRANLKRELKAGRVNIVDLLTNPPEEILTAKVSELMLAAPKLGRVKVDRMMRTCKISPSKTVEGMTDRQLNDLVYALRRR